MSKFFKDKYKNLIPYTPGEQPKDKKYIKLNTNESPYPPSSGVLAAVSAEVDKLQLYSDPDSSVLTKAIAELYNVEPSQVLVTNGSDEVLNFAFMAFADENCPVVFPEITYGFYTSVADFNRVPYETVPLNEDFTIDVNKFIDLGKTIVIPNPNAPTGILLGLDDIETILSTNPDNIVIIDEAYIDFGGTSASTLVDKYDNLLVSMTFSKSRSMAGARIGFAIANEAIIQDLNTLKFASNPYNVNRMSHAAGVAAVKDNDYYMNNAKKIIETRTRVTEQLTALGFEVLPSSANFVFAKSDQIDGTTLYEKLRDEYGILVRHWNKENIIDYNRITIGTPDEMDALIDAIINILKTN